MSKPRFRKGDIVAYSPHGKDRSMYHILKRTYGSYILARIIPMAEQNYIIAEIDGQGYSMWVNYHEHISVTEIDAKSIYYGRNTEVVNILYF